SEMNTTASNPRANYAAIMLDDGRILYIGGLNDKQSFVPMDQILIYDTKTSTWNMTAAVGKIPSVRIRHSAVLTNDGRIIIYGGSQNDSMPATPSLAALRSVDFMWLEINESGTKPPNLQSHTSTLVGDLMIVAFGNVTKFQSLPEGSTSNIYILNTANYTWTTQFTPLSSPESTYNGSDTLPIDLSRTNAILAIIIAISCLSFFMMCTIICTRLYKRQRRNVVVGIDR
ncbi:6570_t:CDS:2, partial [Acaulospora morrowiae]